MKPSVKTPRVMKLLKRNMSGKSQGLGVPAGMRVWKGLANQSRCGSGGHKWTTLMLLWVAATLTFQVSVEVLEPPHLAVSLGPHGFLQRFPLAGRLHEVFVILRDALDLRFQLGRRK